MTTQRMLNTPSGRSTGILWCFVGFTTLVAVTALALEVLIIFGILGPLKPLHFATENLQRQIDTINANSEALKASFIKDKMEHDQDVKRLIVTIKNTKNDVQAHILKHDKDVLELWTETNNTKTDVQTQIGKHDKDVLELWTETNNTKTDVQAQIGKHEKDIAELRAAIATTP